MIIQSLILLRRTRLIFEEILIIMSVKQNFKEKILVVILSSFIISLLVYLTVIICLLSTKNVARSMPSKVKEETCGIIINSERNPSKAKRIVNGQNVSKDGYPWLVSLRIVLNSSNSSLSGHICGGCLV